MKKHRLCLISVAMMAAGCTTYQHPEPTQAKDALKQAMNEQQKQAAPLTALPKSVQSELLQLNRPQMPVGMPEKRLRIAAHDVEAVEFSVPCSRAPATAWRFTPGWPGWSPSSSRM